MSMPLKSPLPSFEGITAWLNGEPDLESIMEEPILIYFWAISCPVCHANMPKLTTWRETYVPKGLNMIGIHCPRMKTDVDIEQVKAAIAKFGIVESCGIDNMHWVRQAFDNEYWPTYYLFDREGHLKRRAAGKNGPVMLEPTLNEMFT